MRSFDSSEYILDDSQDLTGFTDDQLVEVQDDTSASRMNDDRILHDAFHVPYLQEVRVTLSGVLELQFSSN